MFRIPSASNNLEADLVQAVKPLTPPAPLGQIRLLNESGKRASSSSESLSEWTDPYASRTESLALTDTSILGPDSEIMRLRGYQPCPQTGAYNRYAGMVQATVVSRKVLLAAQDPSTKAPPGPPQMTAVRPKGGDGPSSAFIRLSPSKDGGLSVDQQSPDRTQRQQQMYEYFNGGSRPGNAPIAVFNFREQQNQVQRPNQFNNAPPPNKSKPRFAFGRPDAPLPLPPTYNPSVNPQQLPGPSLVSNYNIPAGPSPNIPAMASVSLAANTLSSIHVDSSASGTEAKPPLGAPANRARPLSRLFGAIFNPRKNKSDVDPAIAREVLVKKIEEDRSYRPPRPKVTEDKSYHGPVPTRMSTGVQVITVNQARAQIAQNARPVVPVVQDVEGTGDIVGRAAWTGKKSSLLVEDATGPGEPRLPVLTQSFVHRQTQNQQHARTYSRDILEDIPQMIGDITDITLPNLLQQQRASNRNRY